jgi:alkanesulfonate monooxygenase SsuD/methylene tetrahydromethanopterin reductase-like flavin-dependent oxidoreductase (luciferase family)
MDVPWCRGPPDDSTTGPASRLCGQTITDRLVDEYCVVGPQARCRDRLQGWHDTGAATLALVPHPVRPTESYIDGVRRTLAALSPV